MEWEGASVVIVRSSKNSKKIEFIDQLRKKTQPKIILSCMPVTENDKFNDALDENKKEKQATS